MRKIPPGLRHDVAWAKLRVCSIAPAKDGLYRGFLTEDKEFSLKQFPDVLARDDRWSAGHKGRYVRLSLTGLGSFSGV